MTLRHLKIFLAVCDFGNMTRAAKELYISQSAVSQVIGELEEYYGCKLFERLSKKLYLTSSGEKLIGYARHIIRMSLEAEQEMKVLQEMGSFRIGVSVTVGAHIMPSLAYIFSDKYPETEIKVIEDNTNRIEQMILYDEIDIGLVEGEMLSSDLILEPFLEDELILICGNNHPFASHSSIQLDQIRDEKLILREQGSGTRKLFEDLLLDHQISSNPIWICNNTDTIKNAVELGLGVSAISKMAVKREVELGRLHQVEIQGILMKRMFKIVFHKNKYLTKRMNQFISLCSKSEEWISSCL